MTDRADLIAPGLTCARCDGPLYPFLARATDNGWTHATCPCVTCGRTRPPGRGGITCSKSCAAQMRNQRRGRRVRCQECGRRQGESGTCENCRYDHPLTGGQWVLDPRRRIQIWDVAS